MTTESGPGAGVASDEAGLSSLRDGAASASPPKASIPNALDADFTLETGKLYPSYTIPMILHCPDCGERHIDEQDFAEVAHHTHACQGCGLVWRPAKVNTHGVRFLPGYKNEERVDGQR